MNRTKPSASETETPIVDPVFANIEDQLLKHLDTLDPKPRLERIEDLQHRVNFERRLTNLAPNQRAAMNNRELSEADRARIDACKTEAARDVVFRDLARLQYFRDCAWTDYLNGVTPDAPVPAKA